MGKFCVNCGRPLEPGELCHCQQEEYRAEPEGVSPPQPEPQRFSEVGAKARAAWQEALSSEAAQAAKEKTGAAAKEVRVQAASLPQRVKSLFKNPVEEIRSLAGEGSLAAPLGMIVANILAVLVLSVIVMLAINGKLRGELGAYVKELDLPYAKAVLFFTVTAIVVNFAQAACLFASEKLLFRGAFTPGAALSLTGGKALIDTLFLIAGVVFAMFSPKFGLAFILIGDLLTSSILAVSYTELSQLPQPQKVYSYFAAQFVFAIVVLVLCLIGKNMVIEFLEELVGGFLYSLF